MLAIPWVDKTIAIVASAPFAVELAHRWLGGHVNFPRAILGASLLVIIITMILRSAPVRITPNPWFWLLAFVATYGTLAFTAVATQGVPLVAPIATTGLAMLSVLVQVYARVSLGRSIGIVPAQRVIVTGGAYRFVRHPIYTSLFIGLGAFALRSYTPPNLALAVICAALFMLKSWVEEYFLRDDPGYAAYLRQVRWRWGSWHRVDPMPAIDVDLLSDTVTRPTRAMREFMCQAEVGDEQTFEDPTVNALQEMVADLLGKETAVFLPSGTMCNEIAMRVHCRPGDEMIAHRTAHPIHFEAGGPAGSPA